MSNDLMVTKVIGHCIAKEHEYRMDGDRVVLLDDGNVVLDKSNAVHPQNMARIFARALANEPNHFIHRVAFGNGGTEVDVTGNILYNPPRDGLNPGDGYWEARLYNETYSEIIDDSNIGIGSGPGASPFGDPTSIEHVSGPGVRSSEDLTLGATVSSVTISVILNPNEPSGQVLSQQGGVNGETNPNADFVFDEIGLFTDGAPNVSSSGYQNVDIGIKRSRDDTGLLPNTQYSFNIAVDGGVSQVVTITTPAVGTGNGITAPVNAITYSDLITVLNIPGGDLVSAGASASITDSIPTQDGGVETYGYLKIESGSSGDNSSVLVSDVTLFQSLSGFVATTSPVSGRDAGVRNNPLDPVRERERMLTHLVFSPVLKSADRVLSITYTLNIVVARTQ